MHEKHRKRLGVPQGHRVLQRDIVETLEGNERVLVFTYDEVDTRGNFVKRHELKEMVLQGKDGETHWQ